MTLFSRKRERDYILRQLFIVLGIAANVLLRAVSSGLGLPVYLDTVGTMCVSMVAGIYPGIIVSFATSIVCTLIDSVSIYFGIAGACVAILAAWFVRSRSLFTMKNAVIFAVSAGVISGFLGSIIQLTLYGSGLSSGVTAVLNAMGIMQTGAGWLPAFFSVNIFVDIVDKGLSFGAVLLILHFIPFDFKNRIRNSGWRQRPLTLGEMQALDKLGNSSEHPLGRQIIFILVVMSLLLVTATGSVGLLLYFRNAEQERKEIIMDAARLAASVVDADRVDEYIREGTYAPGYADTKMLLFDICRNSKYIQSLTIVKIEKDGCIYVFDAGAKEEHVSPWEGGDAAPPDKKNALPTHSAGDIIALQNSLRPYLSDFLQGKEVIVTKPSGAKGWDAAAYYPVWDSKGACVCYACADTSFEFLAGYMKNFAIRVILILSVFFILILAFGLNMAGIYITYPINRMALALRGFIGVVKQHETFDKNVKDLRALDINTGNEVENLYRTVCDLAACQAESMRALRRFSDTTMQMQDALIVTMADLVENRDSDTGGHIQRTAEYVRIIVEGLQQKGYYAAKMTPKFMSDVVRSAPLHDVGKINVPDAVLNKPNKLTDEEYEIMKSHTTAGKKIIEKTIAITGGNNYLKEARNMAAYHHERWDGKGYPEGLHGEVIPLSARIMAVADVFDALTASRVYKPALSLEKALSIIEEGTGTQFDPKCVEVFMEALPKVKVILKKYGQEV